MHPSLEKIAYTDHLKRVLDFLVYQNPENKWIAESDLVLWAQQGSVGEEAFLGEPSYKRLRDHVRYLTCMRIDLDKFVEQPTGEQQLVFLLEEKEVIEDRRRKRFYRLLNPELVADTREFLSPLQQAEAVVREHDNFIEQEIASGWPNQWQL